MSTFATPVEVPQAVRSPVGSRDFHVFMAVACSVILMVSVLGCWVTSIHIDGVGSRALVVLALVAMLMPLPAYWHQKGKMELRDAALTIPWALLLFELLPFPVLIGARLRMPLRDVSFAHVDQLLGVGVPGIMVWAHSHWIGPVLIRSYNLLPSLLLAAIFVPALTGRVRHAKEFVVANVIAFAIAVPTFTLLPAVGPWYFYHFRPDPLQHLAEVQLLALRLPGAYSYLSQEPGIVCFPSFHVVWAVLCVAALWWLRPLRIPLAAFSIIVILSTLTTGWHYFIDVLGGLVLAVLSLTLAKLFARYEYRSALLLRRRESVRECAHSALRRVYGRIFLNRPVYSRSHRDGP